jgi:hypothetical protein
VALQAQGACGCCGQPAVIGLCGTDGDQHVRPLLASRCAKEFELPDLIPPQPQAGQIIALDPEPCTARRDRSSFQRGGQPGEPCSGQVWQCPGRTLVLRLANHASDRPRMWPVKG